MGKYGSELETGPNSLFSSFHITSVFTDINQRVQKELSIILTTVKILKFGTPQTIAIIVLKIEKFDVTLH